MVHARADKSPWLVAPRSRNGSTLELLIIGTQHTPAYETSPINPATAEVESRLHLDRIICVVILLGIISSSVFT